MSMRVFFYLNLIITLPCYFRVHRAGSQLKMSESQTGAAHWESENFENIKNDHWDMLNNYAQKSVCIPWLLCSFGTQGRKKIHR